MKKNKMMRAASALLVAVLLTTSVISGTFAKYTTKATANTTARVARWGFDQTKITLDDLFRTNYNDTVVSSNTDEVIAPGTWGSQVIAFATETGVAPEVDYSFEVVASTTVDTSDETTNTIIKNPNIQWSFHKMGDTANYGTFADMLKEINDMSELTVQANNLPALSDNYVIEWKWIFTNSAANDEFDTSMGNADTLEKIDLTITITATQLD